MFLGVFNLAVDDKNRITLPSKFRKDLDGATVVFPINDRINIYPPSVFEELVVRFKESFVLKAETNLSAEALKGYSEILSLDPEMRESLDELFLFANTCSIDAHGRIKIPDATLQEVSVGKDVVLIGCYSYMELMDAGRFEEKRSRARGKTVDMAVSVANELRASSSKTEKSKRSTK